MISLNANARDNKTKGELNAVRKTVNVPAVIYGGKEKNEMISISKKLLTNFFATCSFTFLLNITIPPNAEIGSQIIALLKASNWFFPFETPH